MVYDVSNFLRQVKSGLSEKYRNQTPGLEYVGIRWSHPENRDVITGTERFGVEKNNLSSFNGYSTTFDVQLTMAAHIDSRDFNGVEQIITAKVFTQTSGVFARYDVLSIPFNPMESINRAITISTSDFVTFDLSQRHFPFNQPPLDLPPRFNEQDLEEMLMRVINLPKLALPNTLQETPTP
jgi:hypothetical protein